jgi:hypothetical protein
MCNFFVSEGKEPTETGGQRRMKKLHAAAQSGRKLI